MKTHKRSKLEKAFEQGFIAGKRGHSTETCPYSGHFAEARGLWYGGWRAGRDYLICGNRDFDDKLLGGI